MWELNYKESWALKNWCFWTVVLEKTLESPLDSKEIQPAHPKGNQSWVFIGRTDVEAEIPTHWPPDAKNWLIWKDPDVGKDWGQEEKGTTEDEMVGWHHWLNGHGFGWTPGVGDGQGGLACCGSWGHKELDTTEWLNWTKLNLFGIGKETDLFQSCGHCWVFEICWHIEFSTLTAPSFMTGNSSTGIPSSPLALFVLMLPKAHLTSHSKMSRWVITPSWLSGSWRSFLYSSSVYSCHLFWACSAYFHY